MVITIFYGFFASHLEVGLCETVPKNEWGVKAAMAEACILWIRSPIWKFSVMFKCNWYVSNKIVIGCIKAFPSSIHGNQSNSPGNILTP